MKSEKSTILIAEDDESNYLLINSILCDDYNIFHAWNGKEAIEIFKAHSPDMILMDIKMPVMDGYESTRKIRELSQKVPIIAVTAYVFEQDDASIKGLGFNGYMSKPINRLKLKEMIRYMITQ